MKRRNEYKAECRKAYEEFVRDKEVSNVKITHIPEPPLYTQIDNYGIEKKQRKFKPIKFPPILFDRETDEFLGFKDMDEEEATDFLRKLYNYRKNGYWFYNGDKLEYITGDHWYYLNFIKIDVFDKDSRGIKKKVKRLPNFVDSDRDFYYFWREAELDDFCFGMLFISGRRSGKSSKALSILLNAATMTPEACVGMQAQTSTIAKSLFKRLVRMWRELPRHPFIYPEHTGDSNPSSILRFEQSAKRSTKKQNYAEKEVLNSWIDHRSTTEHAYDSEGMFRMFIDEASKMEGCDINELYNVNRETMADGPYAWGKMIMTSTAENIGGKTLPMFQKMFERSDVTKRNELGQTPSGLWGIFQAASKGYRFDPKDLKNSDAIDTSKFEATIDEWGYSNEDAARKMIMAQRALLTGNDLIQFTRKYPLTIEEAFAVEKGVSPFNIQNINDQVQFNITAERVPVRGNFEWIGSDKRSVAFYPNENGKWEVSWMPPKEFQCALKRDFDGMVPIHNECFTGVDPYEADSTVEKGSDAAATTWVNTGQFFRNPTKVCRYVHRPPTAEQMFEDVLKQCVFYSSKALIENNAGRGIIRQWKNWGFKGLILPDPLYPDKHKEGVNTRNEDTRNALINGLRTYIETCIGILDKDTYEYGICDFNSGLKEWRDFEADKWTPFDEVVADMLAIHAFPRTNYRPKKYTVDDLVGGYKKTSAIRKLI